MPKEDIGSEGGESEIRYVLQQHRDFLGSKSPVILLIVSILFFFFAFLASMTPGFPTFGLGLIGVATIVAVICYTITVIQRNRNWRLGLEKIIERRASEVIPVDVKSLIALVRKIEAVELEMGPRSKQALQATPPPAAEAPVQVNQTSAPKGPMEGTPEKSVV